ncbi:hypothetical protein ACFL6U_16735 [Planctomycetota bacterium]
MIPNFFESHNEDTPIVQPLADTRSWRPVILIGGVLGLFALVIGTKLVLAPRSGTAAQEASRSFLSLGQRIKTAKPNAQPMDLPVIPGRHDELQRDPFQGPSDQKKTTYQGNPTRMKPASSEKVPLVKLKAIALGAKPKAFINDKFLSVGETFRVTGLEEKTCRVISIDERTVTIQVGEETHILRLVSESDLEKEQWGF